MLCGFVDRWEDVEQSIEVHELDRLGHEAIDARDRERPALDRLQTLSRLDKCLQPGTGDIFEFATVKYELGFAARDVTLDAVQQKGGSRRVKLSGHVENEDIGMPLVLVCRIVDHGKVFSSWR